MQGQIIITVLVALLVLMLVLSFFRKESFDADMREFVPVGADRYGLRGNLIQSIPISVNYIKKDQDVMLSQTSGEKWVSNFAPQGQNCNRVDCPGWYDKLDQCWKCN